MSECSEKVESVSLEVSWWIPRMAVSFRLRLVSDCDMTLVTISETLAVVDVITVVASRVLQVCTARRYFSEKPNNEMAHVI